MRKILLAAVCCVLLAVCAMAADLTVIRVKSDCIVAENGDCDITQTMELNMKTAVEEFTVPVGMNASRVTLSGAEGSVKHQDGCYYAVFRSKEGFTGDLQVAVNYTTTGHVTTAEGKQTFSAELVSPLWELPVERYRFTLVMPDAFSVTPSFSSGYHGADVEDSLTTTVQERAVSGIVKGGLLDRESFTVTMELPEGYFTTASAGNGGALFWVLLALVLVLTALAVLYWYKTLRSAPLQARACAQLPEGVTPAELPILLAGKAPSLPLLACHWATLGYLEISVSGGKTVFRKLAEMDPGRREEEQKLFGILFSRGDSVRPSDPVWGKTEAAAAKLLRRYWARRLFARSSGNPGLLRGLAILATALAAACAMSRIASGSFWSALLLIPALVAGGAGGFAIVDGLNRWYLREPIRLALGAAALVFVFLLGRLGGGLAAVLPALALDVAVGVVTRHGGKRTAEGGKLLERCLGYRRYLLHARSVSQTQTLAEDPRFFHTTLLCACAAGCGTQFAAQFRGELQAPCQWLQDPRNNNREPVEFCAGFLRWLNTL